MNLRKSPPRQVKPLDDEKDQGAEVRQIVEDVESPCLDSELEVGFQHSSLLPVRPRDVQCTCTP